MGKYVNDAKELLLHVGGKENIAAVSHCITRMRFVLNDPSKADVAKIDAMKVVKGTFTQSGQFQVIIGNTVSDFYNDFVAVAGVEGVSKEEVKSAAKQNQNVLQRIFTALAEIFAPIIPAIIVGGLQGILSIMPQYMLTFAIAMLVAVVVPFVLTVIVGKKKMAN